MSWVLSKTPSLYQGTVLSEDDLGTIKIALASAASTSMDFWGRTHPGEGSKNIYDIALDRVMAMEEEGTTFDNLSLADDEMNMVVGGVGTFHDSGPRRAGWLTHIMDHLFSWA